MERDDLLEKGRLGPHHILDRLAWLGVRQEADEIAGVAGHQGHADLAVGLEPANPGTMARAGIDDDEGALFRVGRLGFRGRNPHQAIVDGAGQVAPIHDQLGRKMQDVGYGFGHVG